MLGENKYLCENRIELNNSDMRSLYLLYYPLIKEEALVVYLALIYDLNSNFVKLNHLLNYLDYSIDRFEKALHELEKMGLVITYQKNDDYIFEVQRPLSIERFMSHEILSRLLLNVIDTKSYKRLYELKNSSSKHKGFTNVSEVLEFAHLSKWNQSQEKKYQNIKKITLEEMDVDGFDIKAVLKRVNLPDDLKEKDVLEFIARSGRSFGVSVDDMCKYVVDAIDYDKDENGFPCLNPRFNKSKLIYFISKSKHFERSNSDDPYEKPCATFLKDLQNNKEPTISDYRLIASLSNDYYLKGPVINYLLEYVYLERSGEINPSYVKSIAANWHRQNIDSVLKAKEYLSNRKKRLVSKNEERVQDITRPDYTIDNSKFDLSDEEMLKYLPK